MRHSVGACQISYRHFLTTGAGWASTDHTQGRILWHLGCRDSDSKLRSVVLDSRKTWKRCPPLRCWRAAHWGAGLELLLQGLRWLTFPMGGERVTGARSRGMARWPLKGSDLAFPPGRGGDRGLLMVLDGALILTWLNSSILKPKILNSAKTNFLEIFLKFRFPNHIFWENLWIQGQKGSYLGHDF